MNNRGKKMGLLLTGMALGATFCGGAAAAGIVAVPTRQPIYVDGQQVKMEAYNINGSNYVKLRDAGRQVGFNVYWDNGVQVDTGAPTPAWRRHAMSNRYLPRISHPCGRKSLIEPTSSVRRLA